MKIKLAKSAVILTVLAKASLGLSCSGSYYHYGNFKETTSLEKQRIDQAIVFDWDDTLFPTTFYQNYMNMHDYGYNTEIKEQMGKDLRKVDEAVHKLLTSALKSNKVYIISNASQDWLEETSKLYPKSRSLFNFKREKEGFVTVFSARGYFENSLPEDNSDRTDFVLTKDGYQPVFSQLRWKLRAFRDVLSKRYSQVISVGDGLPEQFATQMLPIKSKQHIKWKAQPQMQDIILQASGLTSSI
jgi:predicted secreted acid phosphatase